MKSNHFYIIHDDNSASIVETGGENIHTENHWVKSGESIEARNHRLSALRKQCDILNAWYYENFKQYGEPRANFVQRTLNKPLQQFRFN